MATSPRFSSFLLRPEDLSSRAETPEMVTTDVPMDVSEASDPPMTIAIQEDPPVNPPPANQDLVKTVRKFSLSPVSWDVYHSQ